MNERDLVGYKLPKTIVAPDVRKTKHEAARPKSLDYAGQRRAARALARSLAPTIFDEFCKLALESDLSTEQLTKYAELLLPDRNPESTEPAEMIERFDKLSAREFAAAVKRAARGSATSTDNHHFPIR